MHVFSQLTPEVIERLQNGAIGVIPTDTVYGVVGRLTDEKAVERIYQVKGHDARRAVGTILISDPLQIRDIIKGELPAALAKYWPGPISVILPVGGEFYYAHRGLDSLAFRQPADAGLSSLVAATGPLATSSANLSGEPVATTIPQAISYFGAAVDFYVDGGDLSARQASRILRFTNGVVEMVRTGDSK